MHLIKFLIFFFYFVQFISSITSNDNKLSTDTILTTSKPKTSFTRHFTKLFTPFKKLFSSKSKVNNQLNLTDQTNQTDKQLASESVDQLILNNLTAINEYNQTNSSTLIDFTDLIDFNLTEEIKNNLTNKDEIAHFNSIKDENANKLDSGLKSTLEKLTNEISKNKLANEISKDVVTSTLKYTTYELSTSPTYETTTTIYRKRAQKLKEDEIKICFEIDELNLRKCYIQIPSTSNFVHSRNYCETHFSKGRLITINTIDEQSFLILNSIYYFWTAFKVRLGLTNINSNVKPYITAIKPIYKQTNNSIELIKHFNFNQNLIVNQNELNDLISDNKWTTYPTNDDDVYDTDDIRLEESIDKPIFVLVPKLYCLEASLNFEDGQPLYKWVLKDCDQETSSSVCELSELIVEEEEVDHAESISESSNKPAMIKKSPNESNNNEFVNESVNKLVNQFLSAPSNSDKTTGSRSLANPIATESNDEFVTESSEDEYFKEVLTELLNQDRLHASSKIPTNTQVTKDDLSTIDLLTTTLPSKSDESTSYPTTTTILPTTKQQSIETSTLLSNLDIITDKIKDETTLHNLIVIKSNSNSNCTVNEQNPLVYQLMFAINIAFNSFCSLIVNLFSKESLDENQLKNTKIVFLSAIILLLLLLLATVLLIVLVACRFAAKLLRRKRSRLLLDQLSEQRYKKKDFNVVIDKKYDSDCYYNIPHNRNIYVSNPSQREVDCKNLLINNEKYKSIPKEYFY